MAEVNSRLGMLNPYLLAERTEHWGHFEQNNLVPPADQDPHKQQAENFLDSVFKNEITVFEDIQGSKIWVNWDGDKFQIKPKSITKTLELYFKGETYET